MERPIIEVSHASKKYGKNWVVRDASFRVNTASVLCLLGPSGSGKTTTLKMILGLVPQSSGSIRIDGIDVLREPSLARRLMAYIPEMVALHPTFTGMENLKYFASLVGASDLSRKTLENCLERVGLQREAWDRRLDSYSKGMRQKDCVAIALAKNAKVLILDEPTSGLDPRAKSDFVNLLKLTREKGAAIVLATHDLSLAMNIATQVAIMNSGEKMRLLDPSLLSHEAVEQALADTGESPI